MISTLFIVYSKHHLILQDREKQSKDVVDDSYKKGFAHQQGFLVGCFHLTIAKAKWTLGAVHILRQPLEGGGGGSQMLTIADEGGVESDFFLKVLKMCVTEKY